MYCFVFPSGQHQQINLHTECIDQLSKWHSLLQGGAMSEDKYDEMKDMIMEDMKSMKKLITSTIKHAHSCIM